MNPVESVVRAVDRRQQHWSWLGFPVAVFRKFGDDQAGNLAALLAYYAFFSIFPLLLVLVTVLGLVLRSDPAAQQRVLHSALVDFPIIGGQLQKNVHSLQHTGVGLVVGLIGTLLGARGVSSAAQQAFNTVWHVPYVRRPGFPWNQLRSLALLLVIGLAVVVTGGLSGIGGGLATQGAAIRVAAVVLSAALNIGLFVLGFRLAIAREVALRQFVLSAVLSALVWQLLLAAGGFVVDHQLRHASQIYGLFGLVLGLLAWLHLQAQVTLYVIEIDVVRALRLWPRGLAQPPLTSGDKRAYERYAKTEERRQEENVDVRFED